MNSNLRTNSLLSTMTLAAVLASGLGAQSIAYGIQTGQLNATADFFQNSLVCSTGVWHPTATINGLVSGSLISCPNYDGWSVSINPGADHSILWSFVGGARATDGMQILQNYSVYAYSMYLVHFDLAYTTDPYPTLNSQFYPLFNLTVSGVPANISGNSIHAFPPTSWAGSAGMDYRIGWAPVNATAIRMHTPPNAGSYSGNYGFVISEVSFRAAPSLGSFQSIAPGCAGSNGVPTLAAAVNTLPVAGQPFTVISTHLPWPTAPAFLLVGATAFTPPLDLGIFGAPGCAVAVNPTVFPAMPNVIGLGQLAVMMPNMVGFEFFAQVVVFDAPANALGLTVSNACRGVTGA